jgi:hypothetical protein
VGATYVSVSLTIPAKLELRSPPLPYAKQIAGADDTCKQRGRVLPVTYIGLLAHVCVCVGMPVASRRAIDGGGQPKRMGYKGKPFTFERFVQFKIPTR